MTSAAPEAVVWIASYPKSGNTWVQGVVRTAGQRYGIPREDLDVYKLIADKRAPEAVGGIRPEVSTAPATVLKTHSRFFASREIHSELALNTAGFVYVMRNPLDLLLSYINYTRAQYETRRDVKRFQEGLFIELLGYGEIIPYETWVNVKLEDIPRANLDHALARFTESDTVIPGERVAGGSWLDHADSWLKAGKTLPSVVLRYEDLLKRPEYFLPLGRLFTFREGEIIRAVNRVNDRFRERQYKSIFFNKMSSYYYPQFFSRQVVARFLARYEKRLVQLGYGDLPEGG